MRPQQSYAPASVAPQQDSRADLMRKTNQAAVDCAKRNRESPNGKIVESSILIFSETQSNKFDLLSSKARLNEGQKKALKQFLAETTPCRSMRLDGFKGTAYLSILQKDYGSKDILYGKLLAGQMTIGDANTAIKQINLDTADAFKAANSQASRPQAPAGPGNIIGQAYDGDAKGNIYLYDGSCRIPSYKGRYPLRWDAKRADNGASIGEGCYNVNQQQVTMVATTGMTASRPMSMFQGGSGGGSVFQSVLDGIKRAADYANKSAADTQRNTVNLTPGMTGGSNSMNCTPDGRGGYNCR